MEVREVFKLEDPDSGRVLKVHVTENELKEIVQVGLFRMLQDGWIHFKSIEEELKEAMAELPPDATMN